jgi:hypothetical protein
MRFLNNMVACPSLKFLGSLMGVVTPFIVFYPGRFLGLNSLVGMEAH